MAAPLGLNIQKANISQRRNKPLRGVLSLRSSRSTLSAISTKALTRRAFVLVRSLTMTYFGYDITSKKPI
jgi:hypothetical protein